jgi:hypothetical protein
MPQELAGKQVHGQHLRSVYLRFKRILPLGELMRKQSVNPLERIHISPVVYQESPG